MLKGKTGMPPDIRLRIILIEDNDEVRNSLTELLTIRGHEVFAFSKPTICPMQMKPECRCTVDQRCADAILSNLLMSNMAGLTLIENQKKKNCKCKYVALMSGNWTYQELWYAYQLGCETFEKPFPSAVLFDWLDEVEVSIEPERELCNWFQESEGD